MKSSFVFQELKLSEQLLTEVYSLRRQVEDLTIQREEMQNVINNLEKQNLDLRKTNKELVTKNMKITKKAKNYRRDYESETLMV